MGEDRQTPFNTTLLEIEHNAYSKTQILKSALHYVGHLISSATNLIT